MSGQRLERTCATSGFRLVAADGELAYRVAQDRYVHAGGILAAPTNNLVGAGAPGSRDRRGRFDTLGTTVYFADSPDCCFAEVLQGFRLSRQAVEKDARAIEPEPGEAPISVEEYIEAVKQDARANGIDVPWSVSGDWQHARSVWQARMPRHGWWVRIDHTDTVDALNHELVEFIGPLRDDPARTNEPLDLGDVLSLNRPLTTYLAQAVRRAVLDDGTLPLGIEFPSKTGAGRCYAYFARRLDDGLDPGPDEPRVEHSWNVDTPAFRTRCARWGLEVLPGRPAYV